ncbi:hypothetical protein C1H46_015386 [Malus baccata]|uniref:Major facilitator superfamily (MFS) profile domain-containing protein n=1 Tax=Malus baccata TaxID=106549 RepID=A0A540MKU1_MALBA|nr:hypothetical protein C1H46_015386 [Malus baccata]
MTLFVILSCMMAAIGGVIFGYDIGISGGVTSMELFLKKFFPEVNTKMKSDTKISNYCKFDSELLTSFTSSLYIAGLVASLFASLVTRAYGRKPSILAGGAAFLAGSALNGAAMNLYMLILGRLLIGVGIGFGNQAFPLYLSEMAPPKYRGAINNGFQFSISIGLLSANLINYGSEKIKGGWGWRISLAMAAVPASMLTPNSLIQRSTDHQTAKKMLQRIRGVDDVQAELDDLIKANNISKNIKHPFKKILERKYRPQLVMAIAIPFFQQVTGINVISIYSAVLFRTIGFGESTSLLFVVLTTGVVAGFGWSWGPLGWLVRSETFPLEIRSAGQSINVVVNFLFTFIVAQTFLAMLCHFKAGIFFFFGGWVAVMTVFVYLFLPETKNVPIEKMEIVWQEHWFWRRIVGDSSKDTKMEAP